MSETRRDVMTGGAAAIVEGTGALGACEKPDRGPHADHFPEVVVVSHEKRQALFYDDLLLGRTAIIHCFSIEHDAHYPVTANLSRVQEHLGDRLGHDVFIYSLTTDPEHDTPDALARFARSHDAGDGWLFLTGRPADMELLRSRLFVHGRGVQRDFQRDCSMGLLRYGNESLGLWGSVPAKSDPEWIAKRVGWISPRVAEADTALATTPRRRGPTPGHPFPGAVVDPV